MPGLQALFQIATTEPALHRQNISEEAGLSSSLQKMNTHRDRYIERERLRKRERANSQNSAMLHLVLVLE